MTRRKPIARTCDEWCVRRECFGENGEEAAGWKDGENDRYLLVEDTYKGKRNNGLETSGHFGE
jgi:hypothetical protein